MKKIILVLSMLVASTALHGASTPDTRSVQSTEVTDMHHVSGSDQELKKTVEDKISSGWFSKGYDLVKVHVNNGHVTLTGFVGSIEDKGKVEKEVKGIEGVKSVTNHVEVKSVNK